MSQRVLTELRVIPLYVGRLLYPVPSRLNLDYDFPLSRSLVDPLTTLLSLGVIIAALGLAFLLARKDRLLSFCLFWFFGNLALESSILGLEIVYEHRTYLPSMLFILAAVVLADRNLASKPLKITAACSIVMVLCAWTYERNTVWRSAVSLWRDTVNKSPQKARPRNNLANALKRQGELAEAIAHYKIALSIKPDYAKAFNNLGTALAAAGDIELALVQFRRALALEPRFAEAHNNLGVAMAGQERFQEALAHFATALQFKPDHADAHKNMGMALIRTDRLQEAMEHFQAALALTPDDEEARRYVEFCRQRLGSNTRQPTPIAPPPAPLND
jgi:tetratricopeptide (TPR) repeat protein